MEGRLAGRRVAILVAAEGAEQVELAEPRKALDDEGAMTELISPKGPEIQAFNHLDRGDTFALDRTLDAASSSDYDALLLPGGVANPDSLRQHEGAVQFVKDFFDDSRAVAAICHAPWLLVEADVVHGRVLTSFPSLRTDIANAGGTWVDQQVVTDHGLVTSRKPADLPAFCQKTVEEIAERRYASVR